jgi:hypothetical protein
MLSWVVVIIVGILTSCLWAYVIIPYLNNRRNRMGRLRKLVNEASFGEKLVGFAIAVVAILVLFNC